MVGASLVNLCAYLSLRAKPFMSGTAIIIQYFKKYFNIGQALIISFFPFHIISTVTGTFD